MQAWYNGGIVVRADQYKSDGTWLRVQFLQLAGPGVPSRVYVRSSLGKTACISHKAVFRPTDAAQLAVFQYRFEVKLCVLVVRRIRCRCYRPEHFTRKNLEANAENLGCLLGDRGRTACAAGFPYLHQSRSVSEGKVRSICTQMGQGRPGSIHLHVM